MNNLENKIEAILFFKGEMMSLKKLSQTLKESGESLVIAINNLENSLKNRGIILVRKDDEIALGVHKDLSLMIENLQKEELNKDLSKASLEVLSIILYKNGASRSEIDYIRGVNSSFSLRALSVRGLIEKIVSFEDSRKFIYKPTFDLLSFMGISKIEELPNFEDLSLNIESSLEELNKENKNKDE